MTEKINSFPGFRIILGAAALVIIISGIYLAQAVVVLFLVSVFLASLGILHLEVSSSILPFNPAYFSLNLFKKNSLPLLR